MCGCMLKPIVSDALTEVHSGSFFSFQFICGSKTNLSKLAKMKGEPDEFSPSLELCKILFLTYVELPHI